MSNSQNYNDEVANGSIMFAEEFGLTEEEQEIEQRQLEEDLTDIFMDIGPPTRELAPLKLSRPSHHKLKTKALIKLNVPQADPSIDPADIDDADPDFHLFNNHMFHHLSGLSNLKKILESKALSLDLEFSSPETSFYKEDSYDHALVYGASSSPQKKPS